MRIVAAPTAEDVSSEREGEYFLELMVEVESIDRYLCEDCA